MTRNRVYIALKIGYNHIVSGLVNHNEVLYKGGESETMLNGYKIIALCLSRIQDATSISFVSKLNEALSELGYRLFLYHISTDLYWSERAGDSEMLVYELIDYAVVDTVMIMDEKIKNRILVEHIISNARAADIPVVIIDGHYEGCMNVQFDYRSGFEEIVRHVMDIHRPSKMHFMAGNRNNKFSDERLDVFCKVLEEYGVAFDESMVSYGDFWAKPTIKAVMNLIDTQRIPDAIICANDIMAINVVAVLKKYGYRVPEDVIVTGFDGIEEVHLTDPRITTSYCSYRKLADAVIGLVRNGITTGDYYVMPKLIISESCGCTCSSRLNILDNLNRLNSRFYRYQDDNRTLMQIAEHMQVCVNMEEVPRKMEHRVMNHMCCFLNKWCLDASNDPVMVKTDGFDEEMYLLYDAGEAKPFIPRGFSRRDIIPRLEERLSRKYPLIFAELDFMNVSFGYACFSYKSCDSADYAKIPQIVTALNSGIGGLINRRYQRYLTERIEHIYVHDALTGLYNRMGFSQRFEKMVQGVKENNGIVTVVLADLDGLKGINDTYGHVAGDNAIHTVASALKYSCPQRALCVRVGGDEMLAVIEGEYDIERIRGELDQFLDNYNRTADIPYTVSASFGILQIQGKEGLDFEELLKRADALMYQEKSAKKVKRF